MSSKEDVKKIVEYEKKSHSKLLKDTQMVGREDLDLISILQDLERLEKLEKDLIEEREHSLEQAYKILELEDKIERSENANILVLYEKENQDFRYIFQAIKALGELRLEKQVNGEFTYYAIIIGDFCILIEEEQYKLLKEVIKNGRDNKISD